MIRSRPRALAVPSALAAALALVLAAITPVLAAPAGSVGSALAPADHVECNVSFDAEGNLLLGGVALTELQVTVLEVVFAGTDAAAALELAAQADAETCLNLVIDTGGDPVSATLNGHIDICGFATWGGQGLVINDVFFEADLDNELGAFLDATGGLVLCASLLVEDNAVSVDLSLETCATVTLTAEDTIVFGFDGTEVELPLASVTGAADLEVGVDVVLAVVFSGSIDLETDAVTVTAELLGSEGCEAVVPGTLTIVKETNPAGSTEVFTFATSIASGGGVGSGEFVLRDGDSNTTDTLGTHTVTEVLTDAQVDAGWTLVEVTCDDAGATITDDSVEVVIEAGDEVTCTFENALDGTGATTAPTPAVSLLPDTTVSQGGAASTGLAAVLALVALASLGMFGFATIACRDRR